MKQKNLKYLYIILGISMTLVLLLTAVEIVAFNIDHYRASFQKYNITEATGMDMVNLEHTTKDLLDYLKDKKDELDTEAIVHGEQRVVFGERERLHMVDVKDLFIAGKRIRNLSAVIYIIFVVLISYLDDNWKRNLSKTLIKTAIANGILLAILFVLMLTDFTKYFDYFHYIFFDNDLWILDPEKEILIQMLPEGFFYDTATKIISIFVGSLVIFGGAGYWNIRKLGKR
ncbi:MAG: TIGR01906 family membrane protein [Flavobacteriales bacterium]|nr:TIGR01906 family membrane protein [Flavobacteriales bacterium]